MSWAHVTVRSLLTVSVALALMLTSINAPLVSAFRSILILFAVCAFGALIVATINRSQSLIDIEPENAVTPLAFFVGATIGVLAWQFSLALHFPGYFFLLIIAVACAFSQAVARPRKFGSQRHSHTTIVDGDWLDSATSVSALSLLLFVATIPGTRSLLFPMAVLNCSAAIAPRAPRVVRIIGLLITVIIVRYATADSSVLLVSDDSIWVEASSAIIQQTGFWSWSALSDHYNPLHWLAYGVAGWFTKATEETFLFGATMAFPSVMSVIGGSVISLLGNDKDARSSFLVQVTVVIVGVQLIGSQSISYDMGLLAVLGLAVVLRSQSPQRIVLYVLLICVALSKIQFVPVVAILLIESHLTNNRQTNAQVGPNRLIIRLMTLAITLLLVLDRVPLSRVFGWNVNSGWGESFVRFRGYELLSFSVLRESITETFFFFVPAIVLIFVYVIAGTKQPAANLMTPIILTVVMFLANVIFTIANAEYFGWITGAVSAFYLYPALRGPIEVGTKKRFWSATVASSAMLTLCYFFVHVMDLGWFRGLQYTQIVISLLLGVAAISSSVAKIRQQDWWRILRTPLAFTGVALLFLPSLHYTIEEFNDFTISFEARSNFSIVNLGYTDDLLEASAWIRRNTSTKDVIGTNILCDVGVSCVLDGRPLVAAATHRRTFIEAERFGYGVSPGFLESGGRYPLWILDRLQASVDCSSTGEASACETLRLGGVKFLVIDNNRASGSHGLAVCGTFGSIQVVTLVQELNDKNSLCSDDD